MVDVGAKTATKRTAIAVAHIRVSPELYKQIEENSNKKGDVLGIARIAGIMAAKRTSDIIPLCHPLALTKAEVDVYLVPGTRTSSVWHGHSRLVAIQALVECVGPTGVEMEALMAVQGAALTVVDMCKALDRGLTIDWAYVVYKAGGRSGVYVDGKWKYEVGREKFGPLDGRLVDGVGNADVLVRGRALSEMTKTGRKSKTEVRKEEGGVSIDRSAGVDL
jgi:molybdenum cofactor biosynthesis protein MoaC